MLEQTDQVCVRDLPEAVSAGETSSIKLEEPIYPIEFLSALHQTGFQTLKDFMAKHDLPHELLDLVEDIEVLGIEMMHYGNEKIPSFANENLRDVVASISRDIVQTGGVFYVPDGMTMPRDVQ